MMLNINLLVILTCFPLFQSIGKQKNELDLDFLFCQAEEELLRLRKGGKDFGVTEGMGSRTSARALSLSNSSLLYEIVTRSLYQAGRRGKVKRSAGGLQVAGVECEAARYRSHSGECNNLRHWRDGSSHTLQRRILPSRYQDGVSRPRASSVTGPPLPSARRVSQRLHQDNHKHKTDQYSLMLMQWGQFLDHDLVLVPTSSPPCVGCDQGRADCEPIPVVGDDGHFRGPGAPRCLPFTRSLGGQQELGPREQINIVSSYIDGSMVYGNQESTNKLLRQGHLLRHSLTSEDSQLLPLATNIPDCRAASGHCFLAGDQRANEQPGLTVLHTLLMRTHNNIATDLHKLNPHWSLDTVYQETRRIVIAIIQHITYNEFLPRVLGPDTMRRFSLSLEPAGRHTHYDPTCSAGIYNEFSAAAFRFGHSMIQPSIHLMTEREMATGEGPRDKILLRDHFHNPDYILSNTHAVEEIVRGLVSMPMGGVDSKFTSEVTNHLFEERRKKFSGVDLVALNIQRGRDHGLGGYNDYRQLCGLPRLETFNRSDTVLTSLTLRHMAAIYHHPDDVDLFTGLMSEERLERALVGPTLSCLLGLQFKDVRRCDRFWYETEQDHISFTADQLAEIRSVTLSGLLCHTAINVNNIQRSSFDLPNKEFNPIMSCRNQARKIDLEFWKELERETTEEFCQVGGNIPVSPCDECHCLEPRKKYCMASCTELIQTFGYIPVKEDEKCQERCIL